MQEADVRRALDSVRVLIRTDGGDLELLAVRDGSVDLRLLLEDASCAPCVMPRAHLESVALTVMGKRLPDLLHVSIVDPREALTAEEPS